MTNNVTPAQVAAQVKNITSFKQQIDDEIATIREAGEKFTDDYASLIRNLQERIAAFCELYDTWFLIYNRTRDENLKEQLAFMHREITLASDTIGTLFSVVIGLDKAPVKTLNGAKQRINDIIKRVQKV